MGEQSVLQLILRQTKSGTASQDVARDLQGLDKVSKTVTASWKQLTIAGAAVAGGLKLLGDAVEHGLEIKRADDALAAYAGSAEEAERVTDLVVEATERSIPRFAAMQSATRFLAMGLATTGDEAAKLSRIAVTLGTSMGKGPTESIEELSLLLANQSIPRLDTFGVSAGRVRQRMEELAKSSENMNREQRFMAAFMEEAEGKMEQLEDAGYEQGTAIDRLKARWVDFRDTVARFLAEEALGIIEFFETTAEESEEQARFVQYTTAAMFDLEGAARGVYNAMLAPTFGMNEYLEEIIPNFASASRYAGDLGKKIKEIPEKKDTIFGIEAGEVEETLPKIVGWLTSIQLKSELARQALKKIEYGGGSPGLSTPYEAPADIGTGMQHGGAFIAGPGFGGPRRIVVGEGIHPEQVIVQPITNNNSQFMTGSTVNIYDRLTGRAFRQMFEDTLRGLRG